MRHSTGTSTIQFRLNECYHHSERLSNNLGHWLAAGRGAPGLKADTLEPAALNTPPCRRDAWVTPG